MAKPGKGPRKKVSSEAMEKCAPNKGARKGSSVRVARKEDSSTGFSKGDSGKGALDGSQNGAASEGGSVRAAQREDSGTVAPNRSSNKTALNAGSSKGARPIGTKAVILAEGSFGLLDSKTAACVIRYRPQDVVAIMDSSKAGMTAGQVLGFGGDIPVVSSLDEAMRYGPNALLVGIAPKGGGLPEEWRPVIASAISHKLDIVSGLHFFISDDKEFRELAGANNVKITDLRKVPSDITISTCKAGEAEGKIILTVGSDCNVGKMTVAMELALEARRRGIDAEMLATGQTGIYLTGYGIAVDRVVSDYVAGATERLVVDADAPGRWLIVEGQGALTHPAYSGVALGILHGAMPDCLILCHQPSRKAVSGYSQALPPLTEIIRLHEELDGYVKPARVVGLALNCFDLTDSDAKRACRDIEEETGLPAVDPVRHGSGRLIDAIAECVDKG